MADIHTGVIKRLVAPARKMIYCGSMSAAAKHSIIIIIIIIPMYITHSFSNDFVDFMRELSN